MESSSCHDGVASRTTGLPPKWYVKMGFGYNHKIMIIRLMSRHLVLCLLRNIWSARVQVRDWLCKGKINYP